MVDDRFANDNGLLDLAFFEKCFFGKKLQTKDKLIFKIYANELLEMIKQTLSLSKQKRKWESRAFKINGKDQLIFDLKLHEFNSDKDVNNAEATTVN